MKFSLTRAPESSGGKRTIFVVLPAFNEAATLQRLFEHVDAALSEVSLKYHIVLVDDGSADETAAIAERLSKKYPISIIHHGKNLGLGATIRDGLVAASKKSSANDILITMDADDTHTPGLILRMVERIREGFDVVIASRYQRDSRVIGVPFLRQVLSFCASLIFRAVLPIKGVRDYTCGYRAYRAEVITHALDLYGKKLFERDGFECMVDILLKLRKMPLLFCEVPFILRYDHKDGHTKMKILKTVIGSLFLLLKRRAGL
jgi:dolichol-phosphate mannosyltransferase